MAVIGKIQKNSYLLLIVIGLAMLAFIFTDSFKNFGGGEEPLPSGTIYGQEIDQKELNDLEDTYVNREKQTALSQGNEFTSASEDNARDQAFNEIIRKKLMGNELEDLGITVSTDELSDMILGNHIHPWVSQIGLFKNSIGEYSQDSVVKYLDGLQAGPDPTDTAAYSRWRGAKLQWSEFEQELKQTRSVDKFVSLVKKGIFINKLEAKDFYNSNAGSREISYVMHPYGSITEDEVEFTEDDVKAYYNTHKSEKIYNQKTMSAEIEFVEFPVTYSKTDLDRLNSEMELLKKGFFETENNIYFMATKGEDKFYSDTTGFELGTNMFILDEKNKIFEYPLAIDELIQGSKKGDVIGPFTSVNSQTNETQVVIVKVNGFELQKRAWVRHILISTNTRDEAAAKKMSDSIISVIKAKDNFTEMVTLFTEDPGSKATGGEYKWFKQGKMVPEFDKASFEGAKGKLQLVKTTYGYHIIEVLGREDRKLPKLAPVRRVLKPGSETIREVENLAYDFINEVEALKTDSAFYKVASEKGIITNYSKLYLSSRAVTGFKNYRRIQKFAFALDAEEGDISPPIFDNSTVKVAYLVSKNDEGLPSYKAVKELMKIAALKEKKAKHYIELMSGIKNINEVAQLLPAGEVKTATVKFSAGTIPSISGLENKVVGTIFAIDKSNEGSMLTPMQGEAGVFVIIVDKINIAEESDDFSSERNKIGQKRKASADSKVMQALREKADIKDNRQKKAAQGR